jgi:predicted ATPase/DNA-binding SARP family transcriptional activator
VRVNLLGGVGVVNGGATVSGMAFGGRRARVALAALALSKNQLTAGQLAAVVWTDQPPATWQAALRGIIRGLRAACAPAGGADQHLIVTAPLGYRLADGVEVDVDVAADNLRNAAVLISQGRHQAVIGIAEPLSRLSGSQLLPDEDGAWLTPHRQAVDALAQRAMELVVSAAGALGDHDQAIGSARRAVAADRLDERAHRALIAALDRAGDRAGVVQAFEQCRAVLAGQLGVDPSADTVEIYLTALRDRGVSSSARLPVVASTFFGRERELTVLDGLLSSPGLISVAGPGGVGKSRLVLRAVSGRARFPGGRLWVSLAPVAQDALVAATVALAVGVAVGTEEAGTALAEHLAPLGRVLLVLDGCEVVVDGVASLAAELLAACPHLTVVVTSRVALSIGGEHVVRIEPFAEPAGADARALLASVPVRLLLDRVRDGGGELAIDDLLAPYVARLLRRCGGLPLALELVAAQLAAIPVGDLLDHLADVVVEGDDRLRSVARSSYTLLDADEATVFRRLAVLDGAAGLSMVRRVVSGSTIQDFRVVRILRELSARGLVTVDRSGPHWRYQQDDDLHRYARELLVEAGEEGAAFVRLAGAISALLPADARSAPAPFQDQVSGALGSVRSLFGAALEGRADGGTCLELAFRLHRYFAATNVAEGRFWLSRLLATNPGSRWTSYATYALGYLSYWSGDTINAVEELTAVVDMLEEAEDSYATRALIYLGGLLDDLDRGAEAVEYVRRAIRAAARFDADLQVSAAMGMGSVLAERGDSAAAGYARDAIELCRRSASGEQLALAMPTAAMVCWQVGAYEQARAYIEEARPWHVGIRRIARVVLLSVSAGMALTDGDTGAAVELGRQADLEATELGVERELPLIRAVLARSLLQRDDVPGAAECALGALDAAENMQSQFPLAICLETAALIAATAVATHSSRADELSLLATADIIRSQGDRLALPPLSSAVLQLFQGHDAAAAMDIGAAALLARRLLSTLAVRSTSPVLDQATPLPSAAPVQTDRGAGPTASWSLRSRKGCRGRARGSFA